MGWVPVELHQILGFFIRFSLPAFGTQEDEFVENVLGYNKAVHMIFSAGEGGAVVATKTSLVLGNKEQNKRVNSLVCLVLKVSQIKMRISPKSAKPSAFQSRGFSRPFKPAKPAVFGIWESIKHKFRVWQVYRFQNWYQSNTPRKSSHKKTVKTVFDETNCHSYSQVQQKSKRILLSSPVEFAALNYLWVVHLECCQPNYWQIDLIQFESSTDQDRLCSVSPMQYSVWHSLNHRSSVHHRTGNWCSSQNCLR